VGAVSTVKELAAAAGGKRPTALHQAPVPGLSRADNLDVCKIQFNKAIVLINNTLHCVIRIWHGHFSKI
jgi:hypothetical protein